MIRPKMAPILVTGLLLTGLAMIGLGQAWSSLVPSSVYWGPEQARELIDAQTDLHAKMQRNRDDRQREREFAAARDRLVAIQQQLDSARGRRDRTGTYLTGLGVLLVLIGIAIHYSANKSG